MNYLRNKSLAGAISQILRPLIPVLLRNGIAYHRFEEIIRKAYVDEAIANAQQNNDHPTISSVSAETGIPRKKIRRLSHSKLSDDKHPGQKHDLALNLIKAWLNDPRFSFAKGKPRVLLIDSSENSFSSLVNYYAGEIPSGDMLKLLKTLNCVQVDNGLVYLLSNAYETGSVDPEDFICIPGMDTSELIRTIEHNRNIIDASHKFQRNLFNQWLEEDKLAEYREYLLKHSQALLEETETT